MASLCVRLFERLGANAGREPEGLFFVDFHDDTFRSAGFPIPSSASLSACTSASTFVCPFLVFPFPFPDFALAGPSRSWSRASLMSTQATFSISLAPMPFFAPALSLNLFNKPAARAPSIAYSFLLYLIFSRRPPQQSHQKSSSLKKAVSSGSYMASSRLAVAGPMPRSSVKASRPVPTSLCSAGPERWVVERKRYLRCLDAPSWTFRFIAAGSFEFTRPSREGRNLPCVLRRFSLVSSAWVLIKGREKQRPRLVRELGGRRRAIMVGFRRRGLELGGWVVIQFPLHEPDDMLLGYDRQSSENVCPLFVGCRGSSGF
jgi:hypothetical protein